MRIFLSGGGDAKQSKFIDKAFLSALPKKARVLYIPVALKHKYSAKECFKWFSQTYPSLKETTEVGDDLKKVGDLSNFDAIFIGGGNTFSLLEEVRNSGFDNKLIDFLKKGGIVYGGSAGAIILGKTILSSHDEIKSKISDYSGLCVLSKTAVWPHYKESDIASINEFVKVQNVDVLAISEDGGVVFEDGKMSAVGSGVILFSKSSNRIFLNKY